MAIYLDHAATSPLRPEVLEEYVAALRVIGNPASIHGPGQEARELLESGREHVAASLGADAVEVVLTGGGTESVNLGVKGLYWSRNALADRPRPRILTTRAEHAATLDSVEWLVTRERAVVDWIEVDDVGRIRLDDLERALADPADVALVSVLWANNEVGTLQPVERVVALAAVAGVPVHLDAIAAYGSVPIDFHAVGAAALSVSAHKIGGPVGIGALLVSRSAAVEPLLHGGNQQRARSGTQDAAGAVAFGAAADLAARELAEHASRLAALRDRLRDGILTSTPGVEVRGDPDPAGRLPGNLHVTIEGCQGDALLFLLDRAGIAVSTGSACQAGVAEPSHVLRAMGVPDTVARGALRLTLGRETTADDIDAVIAALPGIVAQARGAA
jgi:cysteine desulfurase